MKIAHKVIKYLALSFALFIIFSIISLFINVFTFFEDKNDDKLNYDNVITYDEEIKKLEINLKKTNLKIVLGDSLNIKTNNKNIKYKIENNKYFINEVKSSFKNNDYEIIVTIPNAVLEELNLEYGAGKIDINGISFKQGTFELGAGKSTIRNMRCTSDLKIETGAGSILIDNSYINNLKLNMGVGKVDISAQLTGKSKIESGIGSLNLNLFGSDYKFDIEKGIGTITYNTKEIKNNESIGTGNSFVKIEGGIGSISVKDGVNYEKTI